MAGAGYQVGKGFSIPAAVNNACTTCTVNVSTTGGTISAGTYSIRFTFSANGGETNLNNANQTFVTTGTTASATFQVGSTFWPTGATAMNIYVGATGQESYQGQVATVGGSFSLTSIVTTGRPVPQFNTTSWQDINPTALGLVAGSEFIVHNTYYNNPVAFGIWDGTTQVMFDSDTGNGVKMDLAIHCNANQWLRIFNTIVWSSLQISFDGMQTV